MIRPKRRKSRVLLWILAVLVVLAGAMAVTYYRGIAQLNSVTVEPVDLAKVSDGKYQGEYNTLPVSATVEVTVVDHRITDLTILRHNSGRGKPAEAITDRVLTAQSLTVDAISGATDSSKVILKATELALKKGIK